MRHQLLPVLVLAAVGCVSPTAPQLQQQTATAAVSTIHVDHTQFSGASIVQTSTMLVSRDTSVRVGSASYTVTLPIGMYVTAMRAYTYADTAGLAYGSARILDVVLWRVTQVLGVSNYLAIAGTETVAVGGDSATHTPGYGQIGWDTVSTTPFSYAVESGVTYQIIPNLRSSSPPTGALGLAWVEVDYSVTPTSAVLSPMAFSPAQRSRMVYPE